MSGEKKYCSIADYMTFRDHVKNDSNWNERKRVFTKDELKCFPFIEKIPALTLPLKRGVKSFSPPIEEILINVSDSKEYPGYVILSWDFWHSTNKKDLLPAS